MKRTNSNRPIRGALSLGEMLKIAFPVDKQLLGEAIVAKSIGMLAGPRGGGKSWLALLIGYAIAGKKPLPPWGTGCGASVAILDGEMRAASLQKRLVLVHGCNSSPKSIIAVEENLHIISRDCIGDTIGSIDTEEGQQRIEALIPDHVELIIIDNLSAWTTGGREDSNSWATIKTWLIALRIKGIAVLLIHHAGKNGQQRGSSAHEDLLDYSILLNTLPSSPDREDTCFSIEHTKLRDFIPELRQAQEFAIWTDDGSFHFKGAVAQVQLSQNAAEMLRLQKDGLTVTAIAEALGINKSTVSRTLKKLRDMPTDAEEGVPA